jgi:hypothetical protein
MNARLAALGNGEPLIVVKEAVLGSNQRAS